MLCDQTDDVSEPIHAEVVDETSWSEVVKSKERKNAIESVGRVQRENRRFTPVKFLKCNAVAISPTAKTEKFMFL